MTELRQVLVLTVHPALHRSRVNAPMMKAASRIEGVTLIDLYERFPDFDIDVGEQQALLKAHDVIVFQHPFFWYSCPALLKEWLDLVLEHGFAYGTGGVALHGKALVSAVTTGGVEASYCREGHNVFAMKELLAPFEQTARLCGMKYLPPFLVHGTHRLDDAQVRVAAGEFASCLEQLTDPSLSFSSIGGDRLNLIAASAEGGRA